jgi:hypothetical protein
MQITSEDGRAMFIGTDEQAAPSWQIESVQATSWDDHWQLSLRKGVRFRFLEAKAPSWFLVALSLVVAATPWIPWSRRFSLRTLLIAMTLIALALGILTIAN